MKHLLTLGLLIICFSSITSQNTEALFSDCGLSQGFDFFFDIPDPDKQSIHFIKKTIIDNVELLEFSLITNGNSDPRSKSQFFRVEDQKVYWYNTNYEPDNPYSKRESLFYDFEPEVGQVVQVANINQPGFLIFYSDYKVIEKSTIQLTDGADRIRMILQSDEHPLTIEWIEGIGNMEGGIFRPAARGGETLLKCVSNIDGILWLADESNEEECHSYLDLLPIGSLPCQSTVSIETIKKKKFNIFPNPAMREVTIENRINSPSNLIVRDLLGNKIIDTRITSSSAQIDLTGFDFGCYMMQLIDEQTNSIQTERLIVGNL